METYNKLLSELKRLDRLESIMGVVGWDEQVNMPTGSADLRGEQKAVYTEILHREASRPELGDLISRLEAEKANLDIPAQAVLRDARRDYDRITRIPASFAARKAQLETKAFQAWVEARKENDFGKFCPFLKEFLGMAREEAAFLDAPKPYDYWIDQFDPGMTEATITRLFNELQPELKSIVETVSAAPNQPDPSIFKGFPIDKQESFLREVVTDLGFDFQRGRLDTAVHPFCGGHGRDTRMTTRFSEDNPLDSLSSSVHETGHALYEQGLNDAFAGSALGESVGMAVHESQSRIWENQVGRSRAFWAYYEPKYREAFATQLANVDSETFYRTLNRVAITAIRVDADEVTYNLHIMLRYEMERRLIDGSLSPEDLPEAWNEASARIIGYTPKNNSEGCLQDVHWSGGMFGYFPSYCLGNLLAAQLWYRVLEDIPELEASFASGDFKPLLSWLREKVHQRGRLTLTQDFAREVTGTELSPSFLVRYLKERYLPLYS
jgi:carboxypeptidase Taq